MTMPDGIGAMPKATWDQTVAIATAGWRMR